MTRADLFERAPDEVTVEDIREALAKRRGDGTSISAADDSPSGEPSRGDSPE